MHKKLAKHGNSLALIIDQPILKILNIDGTTELKITTDGYKIVVEPIITIKKRKVSPDPKMQQIYEELVEEYSPALEKLAK